MRIEASDIGMNNAAQIAAEGVAAINAGDSSIDLSAVRTCDSSGVAVVLAWRRAADAHGSELHLTGLPAALVSLATVYGVAPLIGIENRTD